MRYCFLWCLLLSAWGLAAQAQVTCPISPSQPGCTPGADILAFAPSSLPTPELKAFCVGQTVRFELCNPPAGFVVTYDTLHGNQQAIPGCNPRYPSSFSPTLTKAGTITVFALANNGSANAIFYRRTYQVVDAPQPAFELSSCQNNSVLLTIKSGSNYDRYVANFTGGPQQVPLTPGAANVIPLGSITPSAVTVVGSYTNATCTSSASLPLPPPLPAAEPLRFVRLTQAPQASGGATVTVENLQAGYEYSIVREETLTPGVFSTVLMIPPATTGNPPPLTLPGITRGRYQLRRSDACQRQPEDSAPIYTLDLQPAVEAPGQNNLSFAYAGPAPASFYIERNGTRLPATLPGTATSYADTAVLCGTRYTYRVVAVLATGAESVSNEQSATAQPSGQAPPVPPLVASFTLRNTVSLTPVLSSQGVPRGSTLFYSKTAGTRTFPDFASDTTGRAVADPAVFDSLRVAPPCYTVRFRDRCDIFSRESAPTCPAFLTAKAADNEGNTVNLSWTNFTGPDPTVPTTYELLRLAPNGDILSSLAVSGNTATDLSPPTDRQVLRYRLRISGGGIPADTFSYSNVASVVRRVRVQIPTAFTPNGDGLNDVLEVKGRFLENYSFVVVDRNGMEVFRSSQRSETWDGRIRGHAPVNGAYVWRFQQIDETGNMVRETGTVTIIQ
jgi:gliding motility-associated-like protein